MHGSLCIIFVVAASPPTIRAQRQVLRQRSVLGTEGENNAGGSHLEWFTSAKSLSRIAGAMLPPLICIRLRRSSLNPLPSSQSRRNATNVAGPSYSTITQDPAPSQTSSCGTYTSALSAWWRRASISSSWLTSTTSRTSTGMKLPASFETSRVKFWPMLSTPDRYDFDLTPVRTPVSGNLRNRGGRHLTAFQRSGRSRRGSGCRFFCGACLIEGQYPNVGKAPK